MSGEARGSALWRTWWNAVLESGTWSGKLAPNWKAANGKHPPCDPRL